MRTFSYTALLLAATGLTWLAAPAAAQEVLYSGTLRGELIVTGNSLGLDVDNVNNDKPGGLGGVGAFMADPFNWATQVVGTFPAGTTGDWTKNGSSAFLDVPEGAAIDRAILLWSCSSRTAGAPATPLDQPASITLRLPDGTTRTVAPNGSKNNISLATTGTVYYQRWADVTTAVGAGGAGRYTVSGVVGLRTRSELSACGWSLFAVYTRSDLPMRNLNLWNLGQAVRYTAPNNPANLETRIQVAGFCTPEEGFAAEGSMVVTALEGDIRYTGDKLEIFDPFSLIDPLEFDEFWKLSGPNNATSNFFASQINGSDGALDDRGTFGSANHVVGRNLDPVLDGLTYVITPGARQGWDITTIPLNDIEYNPYILLNGQTETQLRIATAGDDFVISAVGISLDFDSPNIVGNSGSDRTEVYAGERITYTFELANDEQGPGDEVFFCLAPSANLSFVPGSVKVDNVARSGVTAATLNAANCASTTGGLSLGAFPSGSSRTVTVQYDVTTLDPAPNVLDSVRITPSWRSEWTPNCAGATKEVDRQTGNELVVGGVILVYEMTASPATPPALDFGDRISYTMTIRNVGSANSRPGTTARIPVPTGTTYVAGSSRLNNAAINDESGVSPFADADGRTVQSVGAASGVVASGRAATASYDVTINDGAPSVVTVRGFGDPDGPTGPLPEVPATPVSTQVNSDIIPDTDNDGILDPDDNCPLVPNPLQQNNYDNSGYNPAASEEGDHCDDTDGDGLLDVVEDPNHNGRQPGETDATKVDTDGDGLCDGKLRVNPCVGVEDTDGDGDHADWATTEPSPIDPDSDDDTICDGSWAGGECRGGEQDLGTNPINTDSDRDGLCDGPGGGGWDTSNCVGSETDNEGDHGLTVVTDPANPDTDGDRLCDGFRNPHDGVEVDCFGYEDRDGDRDPADWALGGDETDPHNPDTDGGTIKDGDEFQRNSDPRDPCDDLEENDCNPPEAEALIVEGGGCGGGSSNGAGLMLMLTAAIAWTARRRQRV